MFNEPTDRFLVRLPRSLRRRIGEAARFYRRSINSEIILRLQHSLDSLPELALERALEPPMFSAIERTLRSDLSAEEESLVMRFRRLSGAKRKALLDLLG
jgi:hypothetical protein